MATLIDIARHTGLAVTTVSEVLRGKPGYNQDTRQRVLQAAGELRYRPNHLGRALKGGPSMSIGVIFEGITAAVAVARISAIEAAAGEHGYLTFFARRDARALQGLLDRRVDGLILSFLVPEFDAFEPLLRDADVPIVYLDASPRQERRCVGINREAGIRELVAHLAQLGHKKAAYFASPSDWYYPRHRLGPYRRAMADAGIRFAASRQWTIDPTKGVRESAYETVSRFLPVRRDHTVLVMKNDEAALAALAAAQDAGLRVPQDLSIVGFDDLPEVAYCRPAITTVSQPRAEAGHAAFEMLHQLMRDPKALVEPRSFDCRLVVRGSTGPAGTPARRPSGSARSHAEAAVGA